MRRKPSASHWVKKPPLEVYRPERAVFFSGAQVLRISSVKRSSAGGRSITSLPSAWRNDTLSPLISTRSRLSSSPCSSSAWPGGTAVLRSTCMRLVTSVLAASRSKARSTWRIQ
jgi:hypothetical protein